MEHWTSKFKEDADNYGDADDDADTNSGDSAMPNGNGHWVVDKRIPLALILVLLGQTGGFIWWAATISAQVQGHERILAAQSTATAAVSPLTQRVDALEATSKDLMLVARPLDSRLTAVETSMKFLVEGVKDIKAILSSPPPVTQAQIQPQRRATPVAIAPQNNNPFQFLQR